MSVLIKGMEMPTSCLRCGFYRRVAPVYDYCCISSAIPKGYVPDDCPLVPVPDHGRLIDADSLRCDVMDCLDVDEALVCIDDAITIIPGEDGET